MNEYGHLLAPNSTSFNVTYLRTEEISNSNIYHNLHDNTQSNRTFANKFSDLESAFIGIFLSLIIILAVGGNILVCVAILTDRKLKKISNLLLMSLAIADLVVSALVMPFAVANDVLGYWPFATQFCSIWMSFDILSATASILNLCAISLDRYINMKNPFRYEEWMTRRKCLLVIAIIWLASLLISFLPINLGWHNHQPEADNNITVPQLTSNMSLEQVIPLCYLELNPLYAAISSSISFYIPCIVMVAIYIQIYKLARHHAKSIKKTQSFDHMTSSNSSKSKLAENKALFTLGMIMGLFLLSWIPFFIVNLVSAFCNGVCVPSELFVAFTWLGYCNSMMNPIIYSIFNTDFREAFQKILCCVRCRNSDPYKMTISRTGSSLQSKRLPTNGHTTSSSNGLKPLGQEEEELQTFLNNNGDEDKSLANQNGDLEKEEFYL